MRRGWVAAGALGAAALAVGGIAAVAEAFHHPVKAGIVIQKEYDDPDDYYILVGKVSVLQHDPEHWRLLLQGQDDSGQVREAWCDVRPSFYANESVGSIVICADGAP